MSKLSAGSALDAAFFDRPPREVAVDLIGCKLLREGVGGTIVETEAYEEGEPACHAFGGITARNAPLFGPPGRTYVYRCYGIHAMFNLVTEPEGVAAAVLVRALEPTDGVATMRERRGVDDERLLCAGPGRLCQALGIELGETDHDAAQPPFEIRPREPSWPSREVVAGPRIGIRKAAELPWRYCSAGSAHLSRPAG